MSKSISRLTMLFGFVLFTTLSSARAAVASDWEWSITPYAWATDVNADISINDRQVADQEIDASDLFDAMDFTSQLHIEGRRDRNGLLLDLFYVDLSDDDKRVALPAPLAGEALVDGNLKLTILDVGGIFNPRGDGEGFSLLYGGRMVDRDFDVDARLNLGPAGTLTRAYGVSETLYDGMLGARYTGRINPHWTYALQADASTGGTEHTWNTWAGLGYSFGKSDRYTFIAGYRYMDVKFEKDNSLGEVEADVTLSGFISGLRISF